MFIGHVGKEGVGLDFLYLGHLRLAPTLPVLKAVEEDGTGAMQAASRWARQRGWKAANIKETTLESPWGLGGPWRSLPFEIGPDEERNIRECVALARNHLSTLNGVNLFDREETRQALQAVLTRQRDCFYAEYLLGVWRHSHGDAVAARDLFERAYRHAPAVIVERFETAGGQPVANASLQGFALECNRVKNGSLDPSLKLFYPRLRTDENGCIYLPVYQTVYRTDDTSWPGGYEAKYPRLGWFQSPARVGLLPVCVLKEQNVGEPDLLQAIYQQSQK
jgi:hypothetical protein